jgi:hypothetical protein
VLALEQINAQRGVSKPAQTDQAKAIRFMVANMDVIAKMIEKYSATVVGSLEPRRRGMRQIDRSWRNQPTNRVIFENDVELITFTVDGHLLHTHKTTFAQRHSLDTWPDFESAKQAFESRPGQIRWRDE